MTLKFVFFNVGHGDSIVVEYADGAERHFGVIDSNSGLRRGSAIDCPALDYLKREMGATRLSFVCITHPHKDHYSGMRRLLDAYKGQIGHFYTFPIGDFCNNPARFKKYAKVASDYLKTQDDSEIARRIFELLGILRSADDQFVKSKLWTELAADGEQIAPPGFMGVKIFSILPPAKVRGPIFSQFGAGRRIDVSEGRGENSRSIALTFEYKGRRVLLGGDGTLENWQDHKRYRERNGFEIAADVVKLPHHGSKIDCAEEVIEELFKANSDAKLAVISANGKGHPDMGVIGDLIKRKVAIRCTNLLKAWKEPASEAPDYSGLDPFLSDYLKSIPLEDAKAGSSCRGEIAITVNVDGSITEACEFNVGCPCNPDHLSSLLGSRGIT